MEFQSVINMMIATAFSIAGWFAKQVWDAVQALKKDMKDLEVDLPTHYVRKDELENRFDKIEAMLNRLFEKLDGKADK